MKKSGLKRKDSSVNYIPITKKELVHTDRSPNFCKKNKRKGFMGTSGRRCLNDPDKKGSCKMLCCGRGAKSTVQKIKKRCKCKFHWCCEVKCETCYEDKKFYTCK